MLNYNEKKYIYNSLKHIKHINILKIGSMIESLNTIIQGSIVKLILYFNII